MELKLGEVKNIVESLAKIMEERLPVRTAYLFAKTLRELGDCFKDFESARMLLLNKYGEKDDNGNLVEKNERYVIADMEAFNKEFIELTNQEVIIDFGGVTIDELGTAEVKGVDLFNLSKLIKDE